jgi:Spy/CpxP family protein refolding chaperone
MMPAFFLSAALAQGQSPTPSQQDQLRYLNEALQKLQQLQQLRQESIQQQQQQFQQGGGGRGAAPGAATPFGVQPRIFERFTAAWWTNANTLAQLGLTDDQKSKIEKIYESHKATIASDSALLATQETQLTTLLAADPVDHNAVLAQIDRVAQARTDLERTNSGMTLEMREVLTAAQWTQLQKLPVSGLIYTPFGPVANPREGGPGQRNGGPRGGQRQQ